MFLNIVFKLRLIIIHPHKNWLLNKIYGPCGQGNTHKLHKHYNFGVFFPSWPYYCYAFIITCERQLTLTPAKGKPK